MCKCYFTSPFFHQLLAFLVFSSISVLLIFSSISTIRQRFMHVKLPLGSGARMISPAAYTSCHLHFPCLAWELLLGFHSCHPQPFRLWRKILRNKKTLAKREYNSCRIEKKMHPDHRVADMGGRMPPTISTRGIQCTFYCFHTF